MDLISKKISLILLFITGFALIAVLAFNVISHFQNESKFGFQMYKLTKLQPGIRITSTHIYDYDQPPREPYRNLVFETNNDDWSLGETKSDSKAYSKTTTVYACSRKSKNIDCYNGESPDGQTYLVFTFYRLKEPSVPASRTISWLKDNHTRFWININNSEAAMYSQESWGEIIDSALLDDFNAIKPVKAEPKGA